MRVSTLRKVHAYGTLLGGMMIHLVLGCVFLFGAITDYLTSYLHKLSPDVSYDDTFPVLPVSLVLSNLFLPLGRILAQKIGIGYTLAIGVFFCSSAPILASFSNTLWQFYLSYAVTFSVGFGLAYVIPIVCAWEHFPDRKGFATGAILVGTGLGPFFFNLIADKIVNPEGDSPEKDGYYAKDITGRVKEMLRFLGLAWLVISGVGMVLLRKRSTQLDTLDESAQVSYIESMVQENNSLLDFHYDTSSDVDIMLALKHPMFYKLFIMLFLSMSFSTFILNSFKIIGNELFPHDEQFLSIVASLALLANGTTRFAWGRWLDWIGFNRIYGFLIVIELGMLIILIYASGKRGCFTLAIILTLACEGGHIALFTAQCGRIFGHRAGSTLFCLLFSGFTLANLNGILFFRVILPSIGYFKMYWIFFGFVSLSLIILLTFNPITDWGNLQRYSQPNVEEINPDSEGSFVKLREGYSVR